MSQGIAEVNDISIWWEDFGDSSNPSVLLIMGANANCMQWPLEFIDPIVEQGFHVVRFDNRDVGKSTWFYKELGRKGFKQGTKGSTGIRCRKSN